MNHHHEDDAGGDFNEMSRGKRFGGVINDAAIGERRGDDGELQEHGEPQHGERGRPQTAIVKPSATETAREANNAGLEIIGGRELDGDASEVRRHLIKSEAETAAAGIDDGGDVALHLFENDEVIEIPVQDGGSLEIANALKANADGPWSKAKAGGKVHESAQIYTAWSDGDFGAKGSEICFEAPGGGDHGETG